MRRQGKKLAQVARIWARGQLHIPNQGATDDPDAEIDAALAAFGLCPDEPDQAGEQAEGGACYLWPCNVRAFGLWRRVQTQWRTGGMGGRTGLDYAGVSVYLRDVARLKGRAFAEAFSALQAMEIAALNEWAQQQDK